MRSFRLFPLIAIAVLAIGLFTPAASAQSCTAATPAISFTPAQLCGNTVAQASVDNASAFTSFSWSIANGQISAGAGTSSISFEPGSNLPVQLTVNVTDANGCTSSGSTTVPLDPSLPTITLASAQLCGSQSDTASVPAGYVYYWWRSINAIIDSGQGTNSITFHPDPAANGDALVQVELSNSAGCWWNVTANVYLMPPIALGMPRICIFGTDTASVPAIPGASYNWTVSNGNVIDGQGTNAITFTTNGIGDLYLSVTEVDASGCSSTETIIVPYGFITAPAITVATPDVCPNGSDTASVPAGYSNYWWTVQNGTIASGQGTNSITFTPNTYNGLQTINVSAYVSDANGCQASTQMVSVPIRTIPAPQVTLSAPDICPQGSDTASVPAAYVNYWWAIQNGTITAGQGTNAITFTMDPMRLQPVMLDVSVSDADGCTTGTATVSVPLRTIPPPSVTLGTPDVCPWGSDTASIPAVYASYWWMVQNATITDGQETNAITFTPSGSSQPVSLTVYVSDAESCWAQSSTVTLPIRTLTPPAITLGTPDLCALGTDTASIPTGYLTYWWSITNGQLLSDPTSNSIQFARTSLNTDPVSLSVYVSDAAGCSTANTVIVPVGQVTAPAITLSPAQYCPLGTNVASVPNNYAHYSWSITNGFFPVAPITGSSVTFAAGDPSQPTVLNVDVYDAAGCSVRSTITVPLRPVATITGPANVCAGGTATLTASSGSSYSWSTGQTTQSITVSAAGAYSCMITDASGCPQNASYFLPSDTPATPTITTTTPTAFCAGGSVTLTSSAAASYLWSTGETTQSITVVTPGSYTVTTTDAGGCGATSSAVVVSIIPNPTATITAGGPTTFCAGGSVVLTSGLASSYLWSTGETVQQILVTAPGSYTVTVTDANGCSATSDATVVTVNPNPTPAISASGPTTFCAGGSVTLTSSAAASYRWSTGATTQSITVATSGSYTVTTTAANGCSATSAAAVVSVNPNPAPAISASDPTTFCAGGSVTLTSTPAASYLWSNGATTQSITAAASGSYAVTVSNSSGCSATSAPAVVTVNPLPATPVVTASGATTFCAGGSVTLTAPGGYTYAWSNGATTQAINVTNSGSFTVTVTDANGCSATSTATTVAVNANPAAPVVTASGPTTFCAGGSLTLTAPAGYSYLWSTNATTRSIAVSASGSYSVTVTDANGCTATSAATTVTTNADPASPAVNVTPASMVCDGTTVTMTAPAGYASYHWSNGATTPSTTTTVSGTFTVTVTDANGCIASGNAYITVYPVPPAPALTPSGPTTFCAGGSVTLTAASGYTYYLWSDGTNTWANGSGQPPNAITVGSSGTYSVQVRNSDQICWSVPASITVTVNPLPPAPSITAGGPTAFCAGGSVSLTAPSGYTYLWSNGATTQSINATSSGGYSVTISDANGCSKTSAPTYVTVNPLPPATITPLGPTTFCAGGSVTLTAPSGTGLSYLWSTGATTLSINATTAGSYTVTVTDTNGCRATSPATVVTTNAIPPTPAITASGPTAFCAGGSVVLTAPAGYTYSWSNGATAQSIMVTAGGSFSVAVTDANGCRATSATTTVTVNANPPTPAITASGPTTFCAGGSVTLTAPAASSYAWSNGSTTQSITASSSGSFSVTITDANGCSATSAPATVTVNPLPVITFSTPSLVCGTNESAQEIVPISNAAYDWTIVNGAITQNAGHRVYFTANGGASSVTLTVTVTDTNGCRASGSITLPVNAMPPTTITASGPTTFCAGGSVTLTAPSGYSYSWSNGAATQSITVNAAGSYTVTVTAASGCSATSSPSVVSVNGNPPTPSVTASGATTFCAGGSVTLTAPGGYTYSWSNGATTQSINAGSSGAYSVTVRDANGCGATSAPSVVTVNAPPATPTITASGPTTFCAGGSVTLTAPSGYSYSWSNGATTQAISATTSGSYTVTVTDANGCSAVSAATNVTVNANPTATITASGPTSFCAGGSVTLTASSGASYSWSNGATTASINVTTSGSFTVTVTDANGCRATSAATVVTANANPPAPSITAGGATTFCNGGSVTLTAPSGYGYLWSNGATTQSITVTAQGSYSVTVTDANGCKATSAATAVTVNPTITAFAPTTQTVAKNGTPQTITVTATGPTLKYQWYKGTSGNTSQKANSTANTFKPPTNATGTFTYWVRVTSGTCTADSPTATVTVN